MAYNLPNYDADNFSFGRARVYLDANKSFATTGLTPTTQYGAVEGVDISYATETLPVEQGTPLIPVDTFITRQTMEIAFVGLELTTARFAVSLGSGTTGTGKKSGLTASANGTYVGTGGATYPSAYSILIVHQSPKGHTVEVHVWKVQSTGDASLSFGDDLHRVPYRFRAIAQTYDWALNNIETTEEELARILRFAAP